MDVGCQGTQGSPLPAVPRARPLRPAPGWYGFAMEDHLWLVLQKFGVMEDHLLVFQHLLDHGGSCFYDGEMIGFIVVDNGVFHQWRTVENGSGLDHVVVQ